MCFNKFFHFAQEYLYGNYLQNIEILLILEREKDSQRSAALFGEGILLLMGCSKKLYNVLGGLQVYYSKSTWEVYPKIKLFYIIFCANMYILLIYINSFYTFFVHFVYKIKFALYFLYNEICKYLFTCNRLFNSWILSCFDAL